MAVKISVWKRMGSFGLLSRKDTWREIVQTRRMDRVEPGCHDHSHRHDRSLPSRIHQDRTNKQASGRLSFLNPHYHDDGNNSMLQSTPPQEIPPRYDHHDGRNSARKQGSATSHPLFSARHVSIHGRRQPEVSPSLFERPWPRQQADILSRCPASGYHGPHLGRRATAVAATLLVAL
jgi:hypothetical protein